MDRKRWVVGMLIGLTAMTAASFSSSLAWYVTSTFLQVQNLEVKIKSERNLLISTQIDGTYVSELGTEDLKSVDGAFSPVSTMFEDKWRDGTTLPQFYEYTSAMFPSTGIPQPKSQISGFFTQTLYLQCDDDVYVTLDPSFCYVRAYELANQRQAEKLVQQTLYKDFTVEEIYNRLNGVSNAMRMSFYFIEDDQYFIVDPNKSGTTYYGGVLDNIPDGYYDYYVDTNGERREVVYGEYNDNSLILYGEKNAEKVEAVGEHTCFNAGHETLTYPFDAEASKEAGLEFVSEDSLDLSAFPDSNKVADNRFAVRLYRDTPKAFQLSIYLEGWDYDCVNAVMGASFLAGLQFKILREAY